MNKTTNATEKPNEAQESAQNSQKKEKKRYGCLPKEQRARGTGTGFGVCFTSETARAAGLKSQENAAKKKRGRELLGLILEGHTLDADTIKECERLGIDPENTTNEAALFVAMFRQAMAGDRESPRAFEQLAKVMGWQIDRHELTGADGAPLIPRTLSKQEAADLWAELEAEN